MGSRLFTHRLKLLNMFYYLEWKEDEIISRIKTELSWESPAEVASTWRFDCAVASLKDFIHFKIFGVTEKEDLYAKMIREHVISREEALKRIERESQIHINICRELLSESHIDFDEFTKILESSSESFKLKNNNSPNKTHH